MQNIITETKTKAKTRAGSRVSNLRRTVLSAVVALILAAFMAAPLAGCSLMESAEIKEVKAQSFAVNLSGVGPASSGTTFGDFVEKYCPNGTWESGTSTDGASLVNYNGGDATDGDVNIQWAKGTDGWSVWAMELNGEPVPVLFLNTYFSQQ